MEGARPPLKRVKTYPSRRLSPSLALLSPTGLSMAEGWCTVEPVEKERQITSDYSVIGHRQQCLKGLAHEQLNTENYNMQNRK